MSDSETIDNNAPVAPATSNEDLFGHVERQLGLLIKTRREAAGMTQAALADAVNEVLVSRYKLTSNTISALERATQPATVLQLVALAHVLEVKPASFLPGFRGPVSAPAAPIPQQATPVTDPDRDIATDMIRNALRLLDRSKR